MKFFLKIDHWFFWMDIFDSFFLPTWYFYYDLLLPYFLYFYSSLLLSLKFSLTYKLSIKRVGKILKIRGFSRWVLPSSRLYRYSKDFRGTSAWFLKKWKRYIKGKDRKWSKICHQFSSPWSRCAVALENDTKTHGEIDYECT